MKRRGHFNMLRDLEKRTDALRKALAQTDLSWNPKLQKQLKTLLRKSEKTVAQFHEAELRHRLHGSGAHLSFPSLPRTAQLLDELAGASLLFSGDPAGVLPLVASANRGHRALRLGDPRTPQQALVMALVLAIQAPTEKGSKEAIAAALQIMKRFRLSERDLERAQASADMINSVESLQVEGKTLEDLMREGVILPTTMGPPGEANLARLLSGQSPDGY